MNEVEVRYTEGYSLLNDAYAKMHVVLIRGDQTVFIHLLRVLFLLGGRANSHSPLTLIVHYPQ